LIADKWIAGATASFARNEIEKPKRRIVSRGVTMTVEGKMQWTDFRAFRRLVEHQKLVLPARAGDAPGIPGDLVGAATSLNLSSSDALFQDAGTLKNRGSVRRLSGLIAILRRR
jgi:hypothetical protein